MSIRIHRGGNNGLPSGGRNPRSGRKGGWALQFSFTDGRRRSKGRAKERDPAILVYSLLSRSA